MCEGIEGAINITESFAAGSVGIIHVIEQTTSQTTGNLGSSKK
jgi:hypothetical protein